MRMNELRSRYVKKYKKRFERELWKINLLLVIEVQGDNISNKRYFGYNDFTSLALVIRFSNCKMRAYFDICFDIYRIN